MSGKTYMLTIRNSEVSMPLPDFISLTGELQVFGVDVEIDPESKLGTLIFRLTEANREQ